LNKQKETFAWYRLDITRKSHLLLYNNVVTSWKPACLLMTTERLLPFAIQLC